MCVPRFISSFSSGQSSTQGLNIRETQTSTHTSSTDVKMKTACERKKKRNRKLDRKGRNYRIFFPQGHRRKWVFLFLRYKNAKADDPAQDRLITGSSHNGVVCIMTFNAILHRTLIEKMRVLNSSLATSKKMEKLDIQGTMYVLTPCVIPRHPAQECVIKII